MKLRQQIGSACGDGARSVYLSVGTRGYEFVETTKLCLETALVKSIRDQLGPELEIHGSQAGMHLAVTLPKGLSDREIATSAAAKGLWLWPLSPSYLGNHARQGLILGFGNTPVEEMPRAVSQLRAQLP